MARKDYEDDPEEYFREIEERKKDNWDSFMENWEKQNPNRVYGHPYPKEES